MNHVFRGLWQMGEDPYFSGNQEWNDVTRMFLSAMFLVHVFSTWQGAQCGPADKYLGLFRLVSNYQLNTQFLYSITIYMLHYNPRHVSSSTMLIFRRTDCIITASGIVTLGRRVHQLRADCSPLSTGVLYGRLQSDDTRWCNNTICPPKDDHSTARNMSRIIM